MMGPLTLLRSCRAAAQSGFDNFMRPIWDGMIFRPGSGSSWLLRFIRGGTIRARRGRGWWICFIRGWMTLWSC